MKKFHLMVAAMALIAPAFAFAATSAQPAPSQATSAQASGLAKWSVPFVGFYTGFHRASADNLSTETDFTTGVQGGWNVLIDLSDFHFVVGGSLFYAWNNDQSHQMCTAGGCHGINIGSTVYGFDARIGYPFGSNKQFMIYIHGGPAHISFTGDRSTLSDNAQSRYGLGFVWAPGSSNLRIEVQYTHVDYSSSVGNWTNKNLTIGLNIGF